MSSNAGLVLRVFGLLYHLPNRCHRAGLQLWLNPQMSSVTVREGLEMAVVCVQVVGPGPVVVELEANRCRFSC